MSMSKAEEARPDANAVHYDDEPPAYTTTISDEVSSTISKPPAQYSFDVKEPLETVDYLLPNARISKDETTSVINFTSKGVKACSGSLKLMILQQAVLPPKPIIHIKGISRKTSGSQSDIEFDIKLNMQNNFLSDLHYMKIPPTGNSGDDYNSSSPPSPTSNLRLTAERDAKIEQMIAAFLADLQRDSKTIVLERHVTFWDFDFLRQSIAQIIDSTGFKGLVEVTFPVLYSKVIWTTRPPSSNLTGNGESLFTSWRNTITSSFFFSPTPSSSLAPTSLSSPSSSSTTQSNPQSSSNSSISSHETNKYTIKTFFPYASLASRSDWDRKCAVQSEAEWLERWAGTIRNAVLLGHGVKSGSGSGNGAGSYGSWLTEDDYMTFKAGVGIAREKKTWLNIGWGHHQN